MSDDDDRDDLDELPPRLPETLAELDETRTLLGARGRGELRPTRADRLLRLVGAYPEPDQAIRWKRGLGVYREELRGDLGGVDDVPAVPIPAPVGSLGDLESRIHYVATYLEAATREGGKFAPARLAAARDELRKLCAAYVAALEVKP